MSGLMTTQMHQLNEGGSTLSREFGFAVKTDADQVTLLRQCDGILRRDGSSAANK
ncbi:hypothetical protein NKJ70_22805 [Mesorhizobium sp. M0092]|uniref:hypothetical protein n=2 Tax=Mesorhizobium TaxID=68287 RepID=UPI003339C1DD